MYVLIITNRDGSEVSRCKPMPLMVATEAAMAVNTATMQWQMGARASILATEEWTAEQILEREA